MIMESQWNILKIYRKKLKNIYINIYIYKKKKINKYIEKYSWYKEMPLKVKSIIINYYWYFML